MNEHLSECSWAPPVDNYCICNLLRACEQRVRNEEQQRIEAALKFVGQHDASWELAVRDKALREARDAILGAKAVDIAYGRRADEPAQFIWLNHALEAIDALRKGNQP